MRTSVGGAQAATGGTASASNTAGGYPASNAFDATNSIWTCSPGSYGSFVSTWLKYDLGSGNDKDFVEFAIQASSTGEHNETPTYILWQYSDDDATYLTKFATRVSTAWTSGSTQSFADPGYSMSGGHRYWRLRIDSTGYTSPSPYGYGGAAIELRLTAGGTDVAYFATISTTVPADATPPMYLLDNAISTEWSGGTSSSAPRYINFDFGGNAPSIQEVYWMARAGGLYTESPISGGLEYSDDNSSYTELVAFSSISWTSNNQGQILATATSTISADGAATDPVETLSGAASIVGGAAFAATDPVETVSGIVAAPVAAVGAATDPIETLSGVAAVAPRATLAATDPVETLSATAVMSGDLIHGRVTDPTERLNGDARVTGVGTAAPAIEVTNRLLPPPRLTNDPARDLPALSRWCSTLHDHLVGTYNVLGEMTTLVRALQTEYGDQTNVATEFLRVLSLVEQQQRTLTALIQNQE